MTGCGARRGYTMVEALLVAVALGFVMAATAAIIQAGEQQHRLTRGYSQVQVDLRSALARATRGIRHAFGVIGSSASPTFAAAPTSGAAQCIVRIRLPGNVYTEARYYLQGNTLYVQKDTDVGAGTPLIDGVTALEFRYFRTSIGVTSNVDGAPATATEVQVRLTATRLTATTPVETLVGMRNAQAGSL